MNFKEKVVIVTGAASGIGAATARYLAKLGASVSIVDINETNLLKVAQEIIEAGHPKPLAIIYDITKDPERIINDTIEQFVIMLAFSGQTRRLNLMLVNLIA